MILSQGIIDELRHQAELQGEKNYRCIEVDWRTIIAVCDEIETIRKCSSTSRVGDDRELAADTVAYIKTASVEDFARGERVVFSAKEYEFLEYSIDGGSCFLNPLDRADRKDSFAVLACNVRKGPL